MSDEKKLGVALGKEMCPICCKVFDGPIIMNTVLTEKNAEEVEKLHGKLLGWSKEPCFDCLELKKKGFILIGVNEAKTEDKKNPYRSGNIWVISTDAADKMFQPNPRPEGGVAFIDINVAEKIGLPDVKFDT